MLHLLYVIIYLLFRFYTINRFKHNNMKTKLLTTIVLIIISNLCYAQNKYLDIQLDGVKYDSLYLYGNNVNGNRIKIAAEKINNQWHFSIPDSVYDFLPGFEFAPKSFDYNTMTNNDIKFLYPLGKDTLVTTVWNFENIVHEIKAQFIDTLEIKNISFGTTINGEYKSFLGKEVIDRFIVSDPISPDLYLRMQYPYYSYFWEDTTYAEMVNNYASLASKHPNSRYLITNLATQLGKYKTRSDVAKVYNYFSKANKQSSWGKMIEKYLNAKLFENILLPEAKTRKLEPIIRISNKYNLVVFSASWCGPCHKLIPTLKEVYTHLKDKMDITYITIDEEKGVNNWNELMQKEQIPWTSLLAVNNIEGIKNKYYIQGIPHAVLVHPGGEMEVVDLYKDKDRLYSIVE